MELLTGSKAFDFNLPGVDGNSHSLSEFKDKKAVIIIFSCNHCPYVQAYEDRIIQIQKDYESKGVQVIAINSNEDINHPDDSFENMVKRAKEKKFNFPYLRDGSQDVAKSYSATHTPHLFLFDEKRELCYTGKMDDNWQEPNKVKHTYLRDALDAILSGKKIPQAQTFAIGCTIKWKK